MGAERPVGGAARRRRRGAREPRSAGPGRAGGVVNAVKERLRGARRALLASPRCRRRSRLRCGARDAERLGGVPARARLRARRAREPPRLRKRSDALRGDRPARIPAPALPTPGSRSPAATTSCSRSRWPPCERARVQTSIGLLAEEVPSLAAEEGIELDLDRLDDRRCLADASLPYMLGVLVPVAGQAESWARSRAEGDDELLYDVMHSVLDDLIVAPRVVGAADARDLLLRRRLPCQRGGRQPGAQAPRLAAAGGGPGAVPVRAPPPKRTARTARPWRSCRPTGLGLEAERPRQGTALIDGDFEPLTDLRFPAARPWTRQVALLLAERICQRVRAGQPRVSRRRPRLRLRRAARALGRRTVRRGAGRRWPPVGLEILEAMRLVRREGCARAAAARDRPPQPRRHDRGTATSGGQHERPLRVHALRADQPVPLRQPGLRRRGRAPAPARLQRLGQVDGGRAGSSRCCSTGTRPSSNLSTSDGQRSIRDHLLLDGLYTRLLGHRPRSSPA